MPEILKKYWRQIVEFWQSLDKSQKTRLYVTSALVTAVIGVSIFMLARPNRVTLIKSEDMAQISQMTTVLTENSIWYSLDEAGTGIIVNSSDKNNARIALSNAGLPKEGTTFADAISMIGISTTESDKEKIWRQQQISQIEANIKMIDGISDATVNLAVPEQSIFISEGEEAPTPQAIVTVKSSNKLSDDQVRGIVLIVSRSVENLQAKDVSVVDGNTGLPLNDASEDDALSAASTQEELRKSREKEIRKKVLEQLGYGPSDTFDSLTVTASVVLDFDTQKTSTKSITNPSGMDGGALVSGEKTSETATNGSANGATGTDSNPGTTSYQTGTTGSGDYSNKTEKYNYAYDEKLTDQQKATGKLVPTESGLAISLWYGKNIADDTKITEEFITGIKESASTATGIPVTNISVNKLKLAPDEVVQQALIDTIKQLLSDYGLFLLLFILIISMLIVAMSGRQKALPLETETALAAAAAGPGGPRFVLPEQGEPLPDIDMEERSEIKKQIDKFVKQKPDAVAQLLRNWLSDEWDV
ncbi:MAG: flagellar M-ring protein FliF [Clostridiales bacterium]|nr:flagellar M-ring protein FliF [Clostridiales bacterium]